MPSCSRPPRGPGKRYYILDEAEFDAAPGVNTPLRAAPCLRRLYIIVAGGIGTE